MYVIVEHTINDPETFGAIAASAELPSHLTLHQSLPKGDGTKAVCLWEGPGVDEVRAFVEAAVGHLSDNVYFAVDAEKALGLPAAV